MMSAFKKEWNWDEINELIGLYEAHPALWDVSINDYRNKELENEIFVKFAEHLSAPRKNTQYFFSWFFVFFNI